MSNRPTPETDAEVDAEMLCACYPSEYVDAEFARKLERERDELREQLSEAKHFLEKYIAERDEAREALDCLLAVIGLTPIAGNKHALQEAVDHGLAVLRKQQEAGK